jgi:hypothetical protein
MKIYVKLESLGFFEWLEEAHNLRDTDMKPEYLDELPLNDIHMTVANSTVFKWFREKYNLMSVIGYHNIWKYSFLIQTIEEHKTIIVIDKIDTYEEAELACIDKLIDIVKQKT